MAQSTANYQYNDASVGGPLGFKGSKVLLVIWGVIFLLAIIGMATPVYKGVPGGYFSTTRSQLDCSIPVPVMQAPLGLCLAGIRRSLIWSIRGRLHPIRGRNRVTSQRWQLLSCRGTVGSTSVSARGRPGNGGCVLESWRRADRRWSGLTPPNIDPPRPATMPPYSRVFLGGLTIVLAQSSRRTCRCTRHRSHHQSDKTLYRTAADHRQPRL